MVIFAEQNAVKDPPFTKLDLICCRNMLIYLEAELQQRLLPLFHYSLRPEGLLFLGTAESVGRSHDQFATVDQKWKIYRRQEGTMPGAALKFPPEAMPGPAGREEEEHDEPPRLRPMHRELGMAERVRQELLDNYAPAAVVISRQGEIYYLHGRTGKYLEPPTGRANWNIMEMAREGLKMDLVTAVRQAVADDAEAVRTGVRVKTNGDFQLLNLRVRPLEDSAAMTGVLLVAFEETPEPPKAEIAPEQVAGEGTAAREKIKTLERELQRTRENLQTAIEELESSNEELKSANEEYQSTNEELQSTNEELQSLNEELITVNAELQSKVEEAGRAYDELKNFLEAMEIPTLFLDREMRVRRFSSLGHIISLIDSDIGRPITDLVSRINEEILLSGARRVLSSLQTEQHEARTEDGYWYLLRILPYRNPEDMIEGVVILFLDIQEQKQALKLRQSEERYRTLVTAGAYAVYRMSPDWKVMRMLKGAKFLSDTEEPSQTWVEKYILPEDRSHVWSIIKKTIETRSTFEMEHRVRRADGTVGWTFSRAIPIFDAQGEIVEWFGAASDITERKQAEEERDRLMRELEEAREGQIYAKHIVDTVREPLLVLNGSFQVQTANPAFYRKFAVSMEETEGRLLFELGNRQWDIPRLRKLLERILPEHEIFEDFLVEHEFPDIGRRQMLLNARRIKRHAADDLILLALEDVTGHRPEERSTTGKE
jgi:two-component system CheB/CheR fusion protein